jgi:hypothetical protein
MHAARCHFLSALLLVTGCANTDGTVASSTAIDGGTVAPPATGNDAGRGATACAPCVLDKDCPGGAVCAQFGGDTYCAATCAAAAACEADHACVTLSTASGDQVNACVPRGDACGPSAGSTGDAGGGSGLPDGGGPICGSLNGPAVPSPCASCGAHACQPNGCYGGWFCNTATKKCQSPPATCGGGGTAGDAGGGPGPYDGGAPATGTVGPGGGRVSRLLFGIVGDTRPPLIDDTAGYPTAIIDGIYSSLERGTPSPPFVVATGDYMFASPRGTESNPQLDLYLAARTRYSGAFFPAMGNHECTGATASNCGPGTADGTTANYSNYLSRMLGPIQQSSPYYVIEIDASDGSWTAKLVFVAANAWTATQSAWLAATLAKPTTYTFVVRHEPAAGSTAPGVTESEAIMAQHPYTLAIVGHTHTYGRTGPRQITVGNGGAPLTGGVNYGYGIVGQRADGALQVDMIDSSTGQADAKFRFAIKADGTPAP